MNTLRRLYKLSGLRHRELAALLALAFLALAIAFLLWTGTSAVAGPLSQESPVSPVTTPAAAPDLPLESTDAPGDLILEPEPAPAPPVPVGVLVGVMAVIGLAALVIALRRG